MKSAAKPHITREMVLLYPTRVEVQVYYYQDTKTSHVVEAYSVQDNRPYLRSDDLDNFSRIPYTSGGGPDNDDDTVLPARKQYKNIYKSLCGKRMGFRLEGAVVLFYRICKVLPLLDMIKYKKPQEITTTNKSVSIQNFDVLQIAGFDCQIKILINKHQFLLPRYYIDKRSKLRITNVCCLYCGGIKMRLLIVLLSVLAAYLVTSTPVNPRILINRPTMGPFGMDGFRPENRRFYYDMSGADVNIGQRSFMCGNHKCYPWSTSGQCPNCHYPVMQDGMGW
ncbi:hypothetical protein evm_001834 [Chilo suppressalis]|nr:hypothetical protein evm_001834 [Chilo suppressalis]